MIGARRTSDMTNIEPPGGGTVTLRGIKIEVDSDIPRIAFASLKGWAARSSYGKSIK